MWRKGDLDRVRHFYQETRKAFSPSPLNLKCFNQRHFLQKSVKRHYFYEAPGRKKGRILWGVLKLDTSWRFMISKKVIVKMCCYCHRKFTVFTENGLHHRPFSVSQASCLSKTGLHHWRLFSKAFILALNGHKSKQKVKLFDQIP